MGPRGEKLEITVRAPGGGLNGNVSKKKNQINLFLETTRRIFPYFSLFIFCSFLSIFLLFSSLLLSLHNHNIFKIGHKLQATT